MVLLFLLLEFLNPQQARPTRRWRPAGGWRLAAGGWRLVSAIEGINGIILIGWSTAFFVTLIARMRRG